MKLSVSEIKELAELLPGNIVFYIRKTNIERIFWSEGITALCGYDADELVSEGKKDALSLVFEDDRNMVAEKTKECLSSGKEVRYTCRIRHKDKKLIWINSVIKTIGTLDGDPVIINILSDISGEREAYRSIEQKFNEQQELIRAREALNENRRTINAAITNSGMLYFEYYPDTHIADNLSADINKLPSVIHDYPESVIRDNFTDEEQASCMRSAFKKIDAGSEQELFTCHRTLNGRPVWLRYHLISVFGSDGQRKKVSCTAMDITLQKEAVIEYQNRFESLLNMYPDAAASLMLNITKDICSDIHDYDADKVNDTESSRECIACRINDSARYIPDPERREEYINAFTRENLVSSFMNGITKVSVDHTFILPEDEKRYCTTTVDMVRNPVSDDIEGILFIRDITESYLQARINAALIESKYECVALIDAGRGTLVIDSFSIGDPIQITNEANDYNISCISAADTFVAPEDRASFLKYSSLANLKKKLDNNDRYFFTIRNIDTFGVRTPKKFSYRYIDGERSLILSTLEDISDVMECDSLTGALNRSGFITFTLRTLENKTPADKYAVLYFGIRGFKAINETFGVEGGDTVLRQTVLLLRNSSLSPIAVARMEADRFLCLVQQKKIDYDEIAKLCHRTYIHNSKQYNFLCRCGIYMIGDKESDVGTMCDRAKMATGFIHDEYVKPYAVFSSYMRSSVVATHEMTSDLQKAMQNNEFKVYYQPVYACSSGKMVSAEALIRWVHPALGVISPGSFVPAFEANGYISEIDMFMEKSVRRFLENRAAENKFAVPVAVNLSRMDFYDRKIMNAIVDDLEKTELPLGSLRFELTESVYSSLNNSSIKNLELMKNAGAYILLDDFGSGYSSFESILDFDFDIIKLDMNLVQKIGVSLKAEYIIGYVIEMAHSMCIRTTAEGVETLEQLEFLKSKKCDHIQGYYYSKPLPADEFERLLNEQQPL